MAVEEEEAEALASIVQCAIRCIVYTHHAPTSTVSPTPTERPTCANSCGIASRPVPSTDLNVLSSAGQKAGNKVARAASSPSSGSCVMSDVMVAAGVCHPRKRTQHSVPLRKLTCMKRAGA